MRRHKINAAAAYKRGERKEAYELWKKASDGMKEMRSKKKEEEKPAEAAAAPAPESAS